jgi:hypothetical protein
MAGVHTVAAFHLITFATTGLDGTKIKAIKRTTTETVFNVLFVITVSFRCKRLAFWILFSKQI